MARDYIFVCDATGTVVVTCARDKATAVAQISEQMGRAIAAKEVDRL